MKKATLLIACLAMLLSFSAAACHAAAADDGVAYFDTTGLTIGEIVYADGLAFERLPDDAAFSTDSAASSSAESFTVTSFGGNTSMDKALALNSEYGYFRIFINNQGDAMTVSIGDRSVITVASGVWRIDATEQWPDVSQTVSFSCSTGLSGSANATLYSTSDGGNRDN